MYFCQSGLRPVRKRKGNPLERRCVLTRLCKVRMNSLPGVVKAYRQLNTGKIKQVCILNLTFTQHMKDNVPECQPLHRGMPGLLLVALCTQHIGH